MRMVYNLFICLLYRFYLGTPLVLHALRDSHVLKSIYYLCFIVRDENIPISLCGSEVMECEKHLLDTESIDLDRGFSRHLIAEGDKGICISLSRPSIINTIRMLLWDKDLRSYSYCIEVSMDNQDWVKILDYSKFLCRSWQTLHFNPRVVRYEDIIIGSTLT